MTRALTLCLALVAGPAFAEELLTLRLHAGAQLGLPHFVGLTALGSLRVDGQPKLDVDLLWEPSAFLQSYSLGTAWRPVGVLAVGPRLRLMQFGAPWSRDVRATNQSFFGLGLEAGVRVPVANRGLITLGLQGTFVPAQATNLRLLVGLTAGFVWGFADFTL